MEAIREKFLKLYVKRDEIISDIVLLVREEHTENELNIFDCFDIICREHPYILNYIQMEMRTDN